MGIDSTSLQGQKERLEQTWRTEHPKLVSRARSSGRSLEEAQDIVGEVFAETMARVSILGLITNPGAWINTLLGRRLIDSWRRTKVSKAKGIQSMEGNLLAELVPSLGLDPLDDFVATSLTDALRDAVLALPEVQRQVIVDQVYKGESFRSMEARTGIPAETLASRKKLAIKTLSTALRMWIED